jgi:hypothetical protein
MFRHTTLSGGGQTHVIMNHKAFNGRCILAFLSCAFNVLMFRLGCLIVFGIFCFAVK